jgi:hypothetical protein
MEVPVKQEFICEITDIRVAPEQLQDKIVDADAIERDINAKALGKHAALAKELGLTNVADLAEKEVIKITRPKIGMAPLTDEENAIWDEWLPRDYRSDNARNNENLSSYKFDLIPEQVLLLWTDLKQKNVFESFEIRTPEVRRPDPALFGWRDGKRYLLARWAESDEAIISFLNIKKKLLEAKISRLRSENRGVPSTSIMIGIVSLALAWLSYSLIFHTGLMASAKQDGADVFGGIVLAITSLIILIGAVSALFQTKARAGEIKRTNQELASL